MATEIKVPVLPESVADAVVVNWYKQPGDSVTRDETLVDIETDKVVLEVPAPADGVLTEIVEQNGTTVIAGQLLGRLEEAKVAGNKAADVVESDQPQETAASANVDVIVSPSAQKLISENNIAVSEINGSGKAGRILKEDVLRFLEAEKKPVTENKSATTPATSQSVTQIIDGREEKRVPMTRLRARIAERLLAAQQNAAILTTFNEVNMQPVMDLRSKYRDEFEKEFGVRLGFMSFFIKAVTEALKQFPSVNASIDGNDVVYHGFFDIGVAVSSPRGLVVPILRDADQLSMAEIEKRVREMGEKAQNNSLTIEDLTGGTFTISNGGVFGSLLSTPILNPPQSGILGMHKIQERPVAEDGNVVIRPMMYLAHSYDHRIIDGREAVQFLVAIKEFLEDPARMTIGV